MAIFESITYIGFGIFMTLGLLFGGLILGLALGLVLAVLRYLNSTKNFAEQKKPHYRNKIILFLVVRFISIVRGTPLILQLSLIYFCVPDLIGIRLNIIQTGIVAFGINSSAYVAEILRSGIENLPKGQFEAAKTLRIPAYYMWKDVIFPQVIKNILPSLISETITLVKETALISTLGGLDLMRRAQLVAAEKFTYFFPILIAGAYYYLLILLIEYIGKKIEQRKNYANR
jgi:polar amino acid transport system permease protein